MHIDMNSYFASVEQQANPFLRGKSVGVCAYLAPNGVIIASSREAKAKGIKTGCKISDAKLLDPGIVLVENEPAKYRSTTEKIFGLLGEYTDKLEPYSIDEAFLDLTGYVTPLTPFKQTPLLPLIRGIGSRGKEKTKTLPEKGGQGGLEPAQSLAHEIQQRIKSEIGEWLDSSIGISYTKFLAKYAGDTAPKAGIKIITPDNLVEALRGRPLTEAWGINTRTEARLQALDINDLLELKNYDSHRIQKQLGRSGYYLWANVNGLEISAISAGTPPPKSVGHSYCIPKKTTDKKYLGTILYKLCEKTGRRLRDLGMEAQGINFGWSYIHSGGHYRSMKLPEKIYTTEEIFAPIEEYLGRADIILPVRSLAVSVARLAPFSGQLDMFTNKVKQKHLSQAMDKINNKYGEYTVINGRMFGTKDMAKDRVGFRKSIVI